MLEKSFDEKIELFNKEDIENYPRFYPEGEDKKLFDAIRNDNLIIFYGAGVSKLAGCAGWIELAEKIVYKFPKEIYSEQDKIILKEMANTDPKKVISVCYHRVKNDKKLLENVYFKAIKDSVTPSKVKEFIEIHNKIFNLNAVSYVTTNIDKGIESIENIDLGKKKTFELTDSDNESNLLNEIKNGNIFYLHGTVDNIEGTIFTVDNYFEFYTKENNNRFLREIFSGKFSVLFIGYSLNEYEILQNIFLAVSNQNTEIALYKHFLLAPIYSKDIAKFNIEKEYFKIFSIKAIPYFIDYDGYGRLNYVLDLLIKTFREHKQDIISVFNEIDQV